MMKDVREHWLNNAVRDVYQVPYTKGRVYVTNGALPKIGIGQPLRGSGAHHSLAQPLCAESVRRYFTWHTSWPTEQEHGEDGGGNMQCI